MTVRFLFAAISNLGLVFAIAMGILFSSSRAWAECGDYIHIRNSPLVITHTHLRSHPHRQIMTESEINLANPVMVRTVPATHPYR